MLTDQTQGVYGAVHTVLLGHRGLMHGISGLKFNLLVQMQHSHRVPDNLDEDLGTAVFVHRYHCVWIKALLYPDPCCPHLHLLVRLEQQDGTMAQVEVDEASSFVGAVRSVVATNYAVPCKSFPVVEGLLDVLGDVFLNVILLHGFSGCGTISNEN